MTWKSIAAATAALTLASCTDPDVSMDGRWIQNIMQTCDQEGEGLVVDGSRGLMSTSSRPPQELENIEFKWSESMGHRFVRMTMDAKIGPGTDLVGMDLLMVDEHLFVPIALSDNGRDFVEVPGEEMASLGLVKCTD